MTLGEIIKEYRQKHKLSMDAFSERSGISKAYISLLEKNRHPKTGKPIAPSVQCIKQAADGMGMDFDALFKALDADQPVSLEIDYSFRIDSDSKEAFLIETYHTLPQEYKTRLLKYASVLADMSSLEKPFLEDTLSDKRNIHVNDSYDMLSEKSKEALRTGTNAIIDSLNKEA